MIITKVSANTLCAGISSVLQFYFVEFLTIRRDLISVL
jgi:hypothetical protein